jgi:GPI mannosyltransferase 4
MLAHKPITYDANRHRPLSLVIMAISALATICIAISLDTDFYTRGRVTWSQLLTNPVITPLNNFSYNFSRSNLALHGLHPWYQHVLLNLPLLIGPAFILLFLQPHLSLRLYSAISGVFVLSLFQHQEARFLLPAVPLILTSLNLPENKIQLRIWIGSWIVFNAVFGVLMGIYHQGGVIPAQVFLSQQADATQAIWWKTYSPPIWLLNGKNEVLKTHDVMGMKWDLMIEELGKITACNATVGKELPEGQNGTYLIAPTSAAFLDQYILQSNPGGFKFSQVWNYRRHLNLDDLDFGDDGVWPTLQRVIGRRGLAVWKVTKDCLTR